MTHTTKTLLDNLTDYLRAECEKDVREATIAEVYAVVVDLWEHEATTDARDALWRACEVIERMTPSGARNQRNRAIDAARRAREAV